VLDAAEPAGRRLDFRMQELKRETNTLPSNSQDDEATHAAVTCAVPIEQMREQVQNVAWATVPGLQGENFVYSGPPAAALPPDPIEVVHCGRRKE